MIKVYDNETGSLLGEIPEAHLKFLVDQLEETSLEDQDYYIDQATIEMLSQAGAEPQLIALLKDGMGTRPGYEIRWSST
jgi:hypothetical protein